MVAALAPPRNLLPAAPLARYLRSRLARETRRELASLIMARRSTVWKSPLPVERLIRRIELNASGCVYLDTAENLCAGLRVHPSEIWDDYYEDAS